MTEKNRSQRGRPANQALRQTIVDTAYELFVELGFQAATLDKVAQRAKISKLSIYRHFENKEALFSAAILARCQQFAPQTLFEDIDGSVEEQLMVAGSSRIVVGDPCPKKATGVSPFLAISRPDDETVRGQVATFFIRCQAALYLGTSQLFSCCWAPSCQEYLPLAACLERSPICTSLSTC